ncbi:hypothetical protein, partial [Methylacidimicrobium cyclopophantes]|uniref:hypothetical protein n=1 Tax=Methylacidimicrobium cyclopophantes TaxID=1041766 RepID=UPI0015B3CE59
RRAALFLKAGRAALAQEPQEFLGVFPKAPEKAYGLVVGRRITQGGRRAAERKGVLFAKYRNGYDREG